jgi:hypothetical protein
VVVRDGPVKTGRRFVRIPAMRGIAAALLTCLAACHATFEERLLAVIPEGADVRVPPAFTPDGRHVAFVATSPRGDWVIHGRWESPRLDAI